MNSLRQKFKEENPWTQKTKEDNYSTLAGAVDEAIKSQCMWKSVLVELGKTHDDEFDHYLDGTHVLVAEVGPSHIHLAYSTLHSYLVAGTHLVL